MDGGGICIQFLTLHFTIEVAFFRLCIWPARQTISTKDFLRYTPFIFGVCLARNADVSFIVINKMDAAAVFACFFTFKIVRRV
jgi:hypothetical protein